MKVLLAICAWCVLSFVVLGAVGLPTEEESAENVKSVQKNVQKDGLELNIVHFNDFHARFEEQNPTSGVCKPGNTCHGGFARLYESVMHLMNTTKNPILLNAGDNFQGTLWYTLFRWNVTQYFMNMLPIKAHTLGNHEFDDKIAGVVPFMQAMRAPCVVCNLNDTLVPEIQGLYKKSITFEVEGKKIAIVGVALSTTPEISSSGDLGFLDEVASVNAEVERLVREENIFSAIVLSHAGYTTDMKIAKESTAKISLIVGGHSHSFLNNGTGEDGTVPIGDYPTLVARERDGHVVPIVQASAYTRYLGNLQLTLGDDGEALSCQGKPIYLSPSLPQNAEILKLMKPWQDEVDAMGATVYGSTAVVLEAETCRFEECNFGNLLTDAMVHSYKNKAIGDSWTYASLALMNAGGIRATIPVGNITYNDLITSQPFANTFDVGYLDGVHIKSFLERTATPFRFKDLQANVNLLQLSGFRVVYDLAKPEGERIVDIQLLCADCPTPVYEPFDAKRTYKVIVPSYVGGGGDGFTMISDNLKNYTKGPLDMDIFREYLPEVSPVHIGLEGRITFVGGVRPKREAEF